MLGRRDPSVRDPAWSWCVSVDTDRKRIKCKFCGKEMNGKIIKLKHHLAGTRRGVVPCRGTIKRVPKGIKRQCMQMIGCLSKERDELRDLEDVLEDDAIQEETPAMTFDEMRLQADHAIARWFYDSCIPFTASNSFHFQAMIDAIANIGPGYKMPSYHELRGSLLDRTKTEVHEYCTMLRESWKQTGCTVMADEWTNQQGRTLLNFFVYCPLGLMFLRSLNISNERYTTANALIEEFEKVILEVGPTNIVHVVTSNATNYKAVERVLADRYETFYWTSCATNCLDLILEDIGDMTEMKSTLACCKDISKFIYNRGYVLSMMRRYTGGLELLRTSYTRFATSILCVHNIFKQKQALKQMFVSLEWQNYAAMPQNRRNHKLVEISEMIFKSSFWNSCIRLLKITYPLMKVLRLVHSEERPSMGYMHKAIDIAKETIKSNFHNKKSDYITIWRIIDNRCNNEFYQHIHAVAHYLNPQFRYSPTFKMDTHIYKGIVDSLDKLVKDPTKVDAIYREMDIYDNALLTMGLPVAIRNRTTMRPDTWWSRFGLDCPNLTEFAIRVLSQTCSAFGCERNWNIFEEIHSKKHNGLERKRLNDLVFVRCNIRLQKRKLQKLSSREHNTTQFDPICLDNAHMLEEWVVEQDEDTILTQRDLEWINVEGTAQVQYDLEDGEEMILGDDGEEGDDDEDEGEDNADLIEGADV